MTGIGVKQDHPILPQNEGTETQTTHPESQYDRVIESGIVIDRNLVGWVSSQGEGVTEPPT